MRDRGTLFVGIVAGALAAAAWPAYGTSLLPGAGKLALFVDVLRVVEANYVEPPDERDLIHHAISGMLSSLDPHSSYMPADDFKEFTVSTSGQFAGVGVEISRDDGKVRVVSPIDNSPAAKAGIRTGDEITQINGDPVQPMGLNDVVDRIRGPARTRVKLTIVRSGLAKPFDVQLTREVVRINPVSSRLEGDVGYVRITQFGEHAASGLAAAVAQIRKKAPHAGVSGYILDLRNDPGGLLSQAVDVSDLLLPRGGIVSTRGRKSSDNESFRARPKRTDLLEGKPLLVLINGGSASASEIVAGALQDNGRAVIMGTRSFGKGSVQEVLPLPPGEGAIRLTTARYYTPSGRSIQARGIVPDVEVVQDGTGDAKASQVVQAESTLKGHLRNGSEEDAGSSAYVPTDPKADTQLQSAIRYLHENRGNVARRSATQQP